jgi:effector-binding domain-containing protein
MNENDKNVCCPRFDPEPWNEKSVVFENKLFVRKDLPQIFHMPLPGTIGRMITKVWKDVEAAGAKPADKDFLWLAYDPSPWKSEHYIHVTREVPGAENVKLSGTFATKVFDGPYNDVPKWIKDMDKYLSSQGKKAQKYYFYYTTCPKCAKTYGHNYVVMFAQI